MTQLRDINHLGNASLIMQYLRLGNLKTSNAFPLKYLTIMPQ